MDDNRKVFSKMLKIELVNEACKQAEEIACFRTHESRADKYKILMNELKDQRRQLKESVRSFCVMRYPGIVQENNANSYGYPSSIDTKEVEPPSREELLSQEIDSLRTKSDNEVWRFVGDLWDRLKDH